MIYLYESCYNQCIMRIVGKVIETKSRKGTSKSGREWQSKQFVVEYVDNNTVKTAAFELFGEYAISSNPFRKGQMVTVDFSLESREYNGNWYTSCNAYCVQPGETTEEVEKVEQAEDEVEVPF